ncbi:hypothetical protein F5Y08DRAFT_355464 [Xylaria arbuscula]|uniref:Uncharacterized protein n=1 Tax=Xylaria arbuscula TaxID=114810 RepID=A0A9W8TRL2_9PEZI|nr:hypothetical protein F5Y08DRAFT_355464 [Xylaria arbuscula]KAJ3579474.1 hypothetical protein NPX13_g1083 [Xylaria arbuscula]
MARLTTPSPAQQAAKEVGKWFQLPPQREKRTQASTMFSTTAYNLTSNVPFRWTNSHVNVFEEWIRLKGHSAATADLVPLLRVLDLDGYEDVKNKNGERVHDLIIVKVRRKISRTKGIVAAQSLGSMGEKQFEMGKQDQQRAQEVKIEPEPADHRSYPQAHPIAQCADRCGVNMSLVDHSNSAAWGAKDHYSTQDLSTYTNANIDQHGLFNRLVTSNLDFPDKTPPKPYRDETTLKMGHHSIEQSPVLPRRVVVGRYTRERARNNRDLKACVEKMKQHMKDDLKELSLVIGRLPEDSDGLALETAADDAEAEIIHLHNLVYEYVKLRS